LPQYRPPKAARLSNDSRAPLRYAGGVSTQIALKLLFELRVVLDRLGESDITLHETIVRDIDRAVRLTDSCIAQLAEDSPDSPESDEADDG
jgi:hypothetical protein